MKPSSISTTLSFRFWLTSGSCPAEAKKERLEPIARVGETRLSDEPNSPGALEEHFCTIFGAIWNVCLVKCQHGT